MAKARQLSPVGPKATVRRDVLLGALMSLVAPAAATAAPSSPLQKVDAAAHALAAALAKLHGGKWVAHIDHELGFVVIAPVFKRGGAQ